MDKTSFALGDLLFFAKVHLSRGTNWALYVRDRTDMGTKYIAAASLMGIGKGGGTQVSAQSVAVAFGDVLCQLRAHRPMSFGPDTYDQLEAFYQWPGSLGLMYDTSDTDEVNDTQRSNWLGKTAAYCKFMVWYVGKAGAVSQRKNEKNKTDDDLIKSICAGSHYAWGAWSADFRREISAACMGARVSPVPKSQPDANRWTPITDEEIKAITDEVKKPTTPQRKMKILHTAASEIVLVITNKEKYKGSEGDDC